MNEHIAGGVNMFVIGLLMQCAGWYSEMPAA